MVVKNRPRGRWLSPRGRWLHYGVALLETSRTLAGCLASSGIAVGVEGVKYNSSPSPPVIIEVTTQSWPRCVRIRRGAAVESTIDDELASTIAFSPPFRLRSMTVPVA